MNALKNPVLLVAEKDYAPAFVEVDYAAIAALKLEHTIEEVGSPIATPQLRVPSAGQAMYCLAMCSLNYQFWSLGPRETNNGSIAGVPVEGSHRPFIRYAHNGFVGAWAMQSAFEAEWLRVLPDSKEQSLPEQLARLREEFCGGYPINAAGVLAVFGDIPEPQVRAELLNELLETEGLATVAQALYSALPERDLGWPDAVALAQQFPRAYGDPYLKKAQLALIFITTAAGRPTFGMDVTVAADYQLPKVMRHLGVLRYDADVSVFVDGRNPIPSGSVAERAIRAATVLGAEAMAAHLKLSIPQLDSWLWLQRNAAKNAEFHLTETTHY